MNSFRAYRIYNEQGRIEGRLETGTLDDLPQGEVTIRVEYSSVNYKDALAATGTGRIIRHFPLIAGIDVAGWRQGFPEEGLLQPRIRLLGANRTRGGASKPEA